MKWLVGTIASIIAKDYIAIEKKQNIILERTNGNIEEAKNIEHLLKLFQPLISIKAFVENLTTPKLGNLFDTNFVTAQSSIEKLIYLNCMLGAQTDDCVSQLKKFFSTGPRRTVWKEVAYAFGTYALTLKKWPSKDIQQLKDILIDSLDIITSVDQNKINTNKMRAQLDEKIRQADPEI